MHNPKVCLRMHGFQIYPTEEIWGSYYMYFDTIFRCSFEVCRHTQVDFKCCFHNYQAVIKMYIQVEIPTYPNSSQIETLLDICRFSWFGKPPVPTTEPWWVWNTFRSRKALMTLAHQRESAIFSVFLWRWLSAVSAFIWVRSINTYASPCASADIRASTCLCSFDGSHNALAVLRTTTVCSLFAVIRLIWCLLRAVWIMYSERLARLYRSWMIYIN